MDGYPKLLDSRENSSMASTWTEYLRLSVTAPGNVLLEVCMYEALAEAPDWGGDDEGPALPDEIGGKKVIGVDDDWIVGGDLCCIDVDKQLAFDKDGIDDAVQWLTADRWRVTDDVISELNKAVEARDR
jgi:hypothetical protein